MERPAGMAGEPLADFLMLVRRVVVEHDVDELAGWDLTLDSVHETDELLMPMSLHVLPDDRAVQDIERREQRRGAVALVIMGRPCGAVGTPHPTWVPRRPGFIGKPGWVRSKA